MKRLAMLVVSAVCAVANVHAAQDDAQYAETGSTTHACVGDGKQQCEMLKPFPAAEPGQVRWVINVPALPDEDSHKIELLPGKWMMVDCNHHWSGADIEQKTLDGWGYTYHVMQKEGPVVSTRMACMKAGKTRRFIAVGSMPELLRYNSRMPIVFYAPEGVELRYRVWQAKGEAMSAKPQ